jgi:hypothetical protein
MVAVAIGVPLLLALWRRQQTSEISWSANFLILRALQRQSAVAKIHHWLILLIRCAALLFLALAVSQFRWNETPSLLAEGGFSRSLRVYVLDTSFSMERIGSQSTLLAEAKDSMLKDSESASNSTVFAVLESTRSAETATAPLFYSVAEMKSRLQVSELAWLTSDALSTLSRVARLVEQPNISGVDFKEIEVVIVSDFDQRFWGGTQPEDLTRWLDDTPSISALRLVKAGDVGEAIFDEPVGNLAISDLQLGSAVPQRGDSLTIKSKITETLGHPIGETLLTLKVDGRAVDSRDVRLRAYETLEIDWNWRPLVAGAYRISVESGSDSISFDNERFLVAEVLPEVDILIVEPSEDDGEFINVALSVSMESSSYSIDRVRWREAGDRMRSRLQSEAVPDFVVVLDLPKSIDLTWVGDYLFQGGKMLFWLGRQTDPTQMRELRSVLEAKGLANDARQLPLINRPSAIGQYQIDPLGYRSPVVEPFQNFTDSGLLTTPLFRYWKVAESAEPIPESAVDLKTSDGDPLLVHVRVGQGMAYWMLTAATIDGARQNALASSANETYESDWNAFPAWPSFVPLNQQIVRTLASLTRTEPKDLGSVIRIRSDSQRLSLQTPSESSSELLGERDRSDTGYEFSVVAGRPGFYQWGSFQPALSQKNASALVAVNAGIEESFVRPTAMTRFDSFLQSTSAATLSKTSVSAAGQASWIDKVLLLVVLALLAAECILAGMRASGVVG